MPCDNNHDFAKAVFDLRLAVGAVRAILAEDPVIAHPFPGHVISDSPFWNDALAAGKLRARTLLHDVHQLAMDLLPRSESELGAVSGQIKDKIERAARCLDVHGDAPSNDDRIAASYEVEIAWKLSAVLVRIFAIGQTIGPSTGARGAPQ